MGHTTLVILSSALSMIGASTENTGESKEGQASQASILSRAQNLKFEWNSKLYTLSADEDPVTNLKTIILQIPDSEPYVLVIDEIELLHMLQMRRPQNISTSGNKPFYIYSKMIQFGDSYAIIRFSLTKELNIKAHYWPFMELVYVYQHLQNRLKRTPPDNQTDFAAALVFLAKESQTDPSLVAALNAIYLLVATCTNPTFLTRILNCIPRSEQKRVLEALLKVCDSGNRAVTDSEGWTALQNNKTVFENMLRGK